MINTIFWLENLKGRERGRLRSRWKDNIIMNLKEVGLGVCTKFIWLELGTIGGLL